MEEVTGDSGGDSQSDIGGIWSEGFGCKCKDTAVVYVNFKRF